MTPEEAKNKSNKELLDPLMDYMGTVQQNAILDHPYWSQIFREIEKRLNSWERTEPRKLKVK